jgi:hypothetical protein
MAIEFQREFAHGSVATCLDILQDGLDACADLGIVLGALGETRASTVHEAFAQIAMVIERLLREDGGGARVAPLLSVLTKL